MLFILIGILDGITSFEIHSCAHDREVAKLRQLANFIFGFLLALLRRQVIHIGNTYFPNHSSVFSNISGNLL